MKLNIQKIIKEWDKVVNSSYPDINNSAHLIKLTEVMIEMGYDSKFVHEYVDSLSEDLDAVLKSKIKNPETDRKIQVKTGLSYKKKNKAAYQAARAKLKDAGISDDEIEKTEKNIDSEKDEKKVDRDNLGMSDDDFQKKNKGNQTKTEYKLPDEISENPKYPKKYLKLLDRMLNTNVNSKDKTQEIGYFIGADGKGMGGSEANIGELMTMMSTTMRADEANAFFNSIEEHLSQVKNDGQKTHVGPQWLKAAKQNRRVTLAILRDKHGNNYEIQDGSWDVKDEVEAMGMNYGDKGFSTDIFFKVKGPTGGTHFQEVSLKQSLTTTKLHNGSVNSTFKDYELPEQISPEKYSQSQTDNTENYYKANQENVQTFIKDLDFDDELDNLTQQVANTMTIKKTDEASLINTIKQMLTTAKEDLLSNPDLVIDGEYIGNITQAGAATKSGFTKNVKDRKKPLVALARLMGKYGDDGATSFMDGVVKSSKDYAVDVSKHIEENEEAKKAVLKSIQEKLPLKSVAEGEEDIVMGETGLTRKTLKVVFGTDNWNDIKENLKVDSTKTPPLLKYSGQVGGKDKEIPIANLVIREDGIGYRGTHRFEMVLESNFGKRIDSASKELYGDQGTFPTPVGSLTDPETREPS